MSALGIGDQDLVIAYDDSGGVMAARLVWMLRATGHEAALLDANPQPDEGAVLKALERNLCRCGVQRRIVGAIVKAGQVSE